MAIPKPLISSKSVEWATPQHLFDILNQEFAFTFDPCATRDNAKCDHYFTKDDNDLSQDWGKHTVFCNPPYGRVIAKWVRKCYDAALAGATVVLLIPSRTETRYFHDWIVGKAELRFVRGRLCFGDGPGKAPFPSMVAVFRPDRRS